MLQQIWTCQRMTVLNWLKKQLMPLTMLVYESCSSPLKWTTLIFVVKLQLSQYCHIKMSIYVDNLKTCLGWTKYHIGSSVFDSSQQISTLLGKFEKYISMSVETLRSGQIARKVGFDLKHKTIIMIWSCVLPGCECHTFPSIRYLSYWLNPVMSAGCMLHLILFVGIW